MFPDQFCSFNGDEVCIAAAQASRFAKEIAGDFNPIHDPGTKRFCVPGDLLFALVLARYGLSQRMAFSFTGMVGDGVTLKFPASDEPTLTIGDAAGKSYLQVQRQGELSRDQRLIECLSRRYVAFSGQNFPHIMVPLLAEQKVMLNPERPLVIYESMALQMDRLDVVEPALELAQATLEVTGRRGDVRLGFRITEAGVPVGEGFKKLVLSGLREYDEATVQGLVDEYEARRSAFSAA